MESLQVIEEIRAEHKIILGYLHVLNAMPERRDIDIVNATISQLMEVYDIWNKHEQKEEAFFKTLKNDFPVGKMEIEHKQIRGHWKVLFLAIESKDKEKIKIALETDGKMFADKLEKHIAYEERLMDKYFYKSQIFPAEHTD